MPDLTPAETRAASELLLAHWREGSSIAELPPELCPRSRAEAYAIQRLMEPQGAGLLRGWKIAATSVAGQKHINVDGPLAGRLLADHVVPRGEPVALRANRMRVAEIEFVFRMGRTLAPRPEAFTTDEVMAAVAGLHLGIEIPDSRYLDFTVVGAPQLIADDACADRFVLGPEVAVPWRERDLAAHAVQGRTARGIVHDGRGANVLGDPRLALTWLANELSRHGDTVGEGHFVTTGTCLVPLRVAPGDAVTADYGEFGTLQVRFTA